MTMILRPRLAGPCCELVCGSSELPIVPEGSISSDTRRKLAESRLGETATEDGRQVVTGVDADLVLSAGSSAGLRSGAG